MTIIFSRKHFIYITRLALYFDSVFTLMSTVKLIGFEILQKIPYIDGIAQVTCIKNSTEKVFSLCEDASLSLSFGIFAAHV